MSTIVALATPPGEGAIHVIRLSGSEAFPIINSITLNKVERTEDRLQVTFIKSRDGQLIDQVVISKYYAPYSYTGEDCIEISCHGNGLISKLIIDEIIKSGAVYAKNGEFTKRAFLNNKIDLNQALNIGALFKAKSELDIYSSVREIKGENSKLIKKYIDALFAIIGECELNVDYPGEIEREDTALMINLRERIRSIFEDLNNLLVASKNNKLSNYRVVIVGKPNAGKSSLVNHLINQDRVLISDRKGTTQDSVEVDFYFEGYLLTLVDTAGVEETEDLNKYDAAKKSQTESFNADLLLYLISSEDKEEGCEFWESHIGNKSHIRLITKSDLMTNPPENSISVKNGNLDFLLENLRSHLKDHYSTTGLKSQSSVSYLNNACEALDKSLDENLTIDLMLEHLNQAYDCLSMILGSKKNSFEKINMLFDGFCVGK